MVKAYLLTVHYDGCFMYNPLRYENGCTLDVQITRICYEEMVSFLEKDTESVFCAMYWCLPDIDLENGLLRLDTDSDLDTLFDIGDAYGHINVYIDHFGDDMTHYISNNDNVEVENVEAENVEARNVEQTNVEAENVEQTNVEVENVDNVVDTENVEKGNEDHFESDDEDIENAYETDDDMSDANSLDHLSEREDELLQVRKEKANAKSAPPKRNLPKLGVGRKNDGNDHEDFLMAEHDEFMDELLKALKSEEDADNKDPPEDVKQVMPYAEHRQCARHIYENFRKLYSGVEFRNLFWKACKASYPLEFERIMHEMKIANPGAHDYLINKEPKTWSRAFFGFMCCCEAVENGFSECFNAVLVKVQSKPIITMLEAIRVIVMKRMEKMRKICDTWNFDICPSIIKKLESAKASQRYWNVIPGGGSKFEVRQGHDAFIIDEENKTCTCRIWQLSGLPCAHAVAAIYYIHKNPDDYVLCWFRKEMYKETYGYPLQPVQGMNQWPSNALNKPLPPKPRIMPGRPRKKRKRSIHEPASHVGRVSRVGSIMTCQKCFKVGHNKKGCKEVERQIPSRPSSKPSGRPKNVTKTREGPSTNSREGSSSGRPEKDASVEKGNGKVVDQGNKKEANASAPTVDKGKGKAVDQGNKKEANASAPTVGGFMTDARKSNKNSTKKYLMPIRKQAQHRINTLNMQRKIKGPGSSSKDAMLLE